MNLKEIFTYNSESSELVLTKDDELFLEKIAKKIHQHGMVTPAVFFLEMTKPLALLGSHFLVFLDQLLILLFKPKTITGPFKCLKNQKMLKFC